jgi:hypothetical protein
LENGSDSVFDIQEEVVDQALDVGHAMGLWERTQPDGQEPDVEIGYGEPGLKCGR